MNGDTTSVWYAINLVLSPLDHTITHLATGLQECDKQHKNAQNVQNVQIS